jgi:hypothetical protein
MVRVRVNIDPEEILDEVPASELIRAIQRRRDRGAKDTGGDKGVSEYITVKASAELLKDLRQLKCPPELYELVEQWANGRMSLADCWALRTK